MSEIIENQEDDLTDNLPGEPTPPEVFYVRGIPFVLGEDGKLYGMYCVTRPEDIENFHQYLENFTADSGISPHIADTSIHTNAEEKEAWAKGAADAASALVQAGSMGNTIEELKSLVEKLQDSVESQITANPFSILADNLDGITLTKGIWNQAKGRIEC